VIETVLGGRRWVVPLEWSTLPDFVALRSLGRVPRAGDAAHCYFAVAQRRGNEP
jgi:hypothetical protein